MAVLYCDSTCTYKLTNSSGAYEFNVEQTLIEFCATNEFQDYYVYGYPFDVCFQRFLVSKYPGVKPLKYVQYLKLENALGNFSR